MGTQKITIRGNGDYEAEKRATIAAANKDPYAPYRKFDPQEDDLGSNSATPTRTTGNADLSQSLSTNNVGFEQGEQAFDPNANGRGPRRLNSNQAAGINPYEMRNM
tara:strand:+ start:228 stop:545 length:318 start_codon:yes stop_codon:yes gene_type:complete